MFHSTTTMMTRPTVRARATLDNRDRMGIFQMHPNVAVTIQEARSAYEVCHSRVSDDTGDVNPSYMVMGVDGAMVEKYIDAVEAMEAAYVRSVIANDPGVRLSIGPFTVFITKTKPAERSQ